MILIDTGPMVSMIDPREPRHRECVDVWRHTGPEYTTSLACITEAFYLLGGSMGFRGQRHLLSLLDSGALIIFKIDISHFRRIRDLMDKFSDLPMDFADATLVVAAEKLGTNRIFTLDSDFNIFRIQGRKSFDVLPGIP